MRRMSVSMIALVAVLSSAAVAQAAAEDVAKEVIALAKAQWASEMAKNVSGAMKYIADDYTEFNSDYPTRVDGKAMNRRLAEASSGASGSLVAAEMANEKVQVYGDVAILTYNFIGSLKDKDGEIEPLLAKSTRVYAKQGGRWLLVHANFGAVN